MQSIHRLIAELEERRASGALCTVTESRGSTPRHVGSKMLVYEDGRIAGTIGGGDLEHRVIDEALIAIVEGKARTLRYNMVDPARGDPGVCGGQVEVFVEPILPAPLIVVIGGGHVGRAVVHLARWLGFRVAVCDDRPEFCNAESAPGADEYHPIPMAELPARIKINRQTYLILTTRGSAVDAAGLPFLLETNPAFIGVIGSKRRWATTKKQLIDQGIPAEKLARIHSPIGIELNAETPEEIAVSVMAEILMIRNAGTGEAMRSNE
jgi:xanthine dehydrogenase accessory factor